jgi:peroxiredoxin
MPISRILLNVAFVLLLVSSLCVSIPMTIAAELPSSADETSPLRTGDSAPEFTVRTVENDPFHFDPASLESPVVLISFRGGWCPYCNLHLSELRTVIPQIREMGFDVLFISNDRPEILYSGLKDETKEDTEGLDYTILSDAELNAAIALGTAFETSTKLKSWLNDTGKDYKESSIARHNGLAVPAVYIVDMNGQIVFDFVNANYKVRLSADDLLKAARTVKSHALK